MAHYDVALLTAASTSRTALIDYDDLRWSPRALSPKPGQLGGVLPWHEGFPKRLHGRAGDLIIYQLRAAPGSESKRRSLETLGLRGIRSASLRFSSDATTWGLIHSVRELVAVLELDIVYYKRTHLTETDDIVGAPPNIESLTYGTGSQPGQIWRDASGDYFGYEASTGVTVAYWSSHLDMDTLSSVLAKAGLPIDPTSSSYVGVTDSNGVMTHAEGSWPRITNGLDMSTVGVAAIRVASGIEVTWRSPYERFDDRRTIRAEVGCICEPLDVTALRALAKVTCARPFIEAAKPSCKGSAYGGRMKEYDVVNW